VVVCAIAPILMVNGAATTIGIAGRDRRRGGSTGWWCTRQDTGRRVDVQPRRQAGGVIAGRRIGRCNLIAEQLVDGGAYRERAGDGRGRGQYSNGDGAISESRTLRRGATCCRDTSRDR
jgi:hypothetical protein